MKNQKIKFWYSYRKDAANHFNVSHSTIDKWYQSAKPELIDWLWSQNSVRESQSIRAKNLKKILEDSNGK